MKDMKDIGIISNNLEYLNRLVDILEKQRCHAVPVNQEHDLNGLDGLIIYIEDKSWFSEVIEWMLLLKKKAKMFTWVVIPEIENNQKSIFFQLGANYVFSYQTEQDLVSYTISNTFDCIKNFELNNEDNRDLELVENNIAMIIDKEEKLLTPREFKVLNLLLQQKGDTISYEEFAKKLWPSKKFLNEYDMRSYIANIIFCVRNKMAGSQWTIQTTRSTGYRLTAQ